MRLFGVYVADRVHRQSQLSEVVGRRNETHYSTLPMLRSIHKRFSDSSVLLSTK